MSIEEIRLKLRRILEKFEVKEILDDYVVSFEPPIKLE